MVFGRTGRAWIWSGIHRKAPFWESMFFGRSLLGKRAADTAIIPPAAAQSNHVVGKTCALIFTPCRNGRFPCFLLTLARCHALSYQPERGRI